MGAWQVVDTLGSPWIELPERLQGDLMMWRWLFGIAERQHSNRKKNKEAVNHAE